MMVEKKVFDFKKATLLGLFPNGSPEWKKIRNCGLGGSDAGAVMGWNKYSSPGKVYLDKLDLTPKFEGNAATRFGQEMEPIIRDKVAQILAFHEGVNVNVYEVLGTYKNNERPFMIANIDGAIEHPDLGLGGLEIKTANAKQAPLWADGNIPDSYMAQVQHYMYVLGLNFFYVFYLLDAEINYRFVERNDKIIEEMIKKEEYIWDCIQKKTPPAPELFDSESLKLLYSDSGSDIVDVDGMDGDVKRWLQLKEEIKKLEEEKEEIEERFKQTINENAGLKTSEYIVTWKTQKQNRFDTDTFKKENPELYKKYTKETSFRKLGSKCLT